MRCPKRARPACNPKEPCATLRSSRLRGFAIKQPLAERQFNRADPDNRLVTGELERRWEAALLELRRAEETLAQRTMPKANEPVGVPHDLRAKGDRPRKS